MEKNIREGVFEYVLTQATSFTEKHSTGDILSRILNDTPKIKGFMTSVVLQLCFDALSIIVAFSILIHRSWVLSLIVFAFAPLAIIAGTFFKAKIGAATHEVQEKVAVFTSKAQTWVNRFGGVKIYGIETASSRQFKSESTKFTHATIRAGKWHILMSAVNAIFLGAPSVLVLVVGGYYCQQGRLSIGELFAFLTFSTYFIAPLQRIIALINVELPKAYPIYERFKEFGMTGGHCAHDSNSWNYNDERGDFTMSAQDGFTLEITSLEYEKSGFRLSIPHLLFHSGMVYGITGANGSGKSTLAKIMKGVLSFKSGKISFVNKDDMIPKSQTFLLSQNTFFFDGSLQENITLFERNNDTKKYKEIIQRLDIEKHELAFSKTVNAEQSRIFSGGEMQKVNIARLMYSNCPVLILDEPDSFTDTKTKGILKGWVKDAKQGRIIIVITHDKEFFDICDIVYSLDQVEPKHSIIR